jgi:hypothetical protein
MRILPDNPSLDFLRQEAKDVLAALRESTPDATLADAQRTLAGEYGFRAWTDLKAEVEKRRGAPPRPPEGVTDALAEVFGLGAPRGPMAAVTYDPMGQTWSIETDRGRWTAGTVYDWIDDAQAERGERLRAAAAGAGVASPSPVRSSRGDRLIETVDGRPWRVYEWMDLGPAPMQPVRASTGRKIGETVGRMHALAIPSEVPINPYLTYRRPESDWEALLDRARAARKPWAGDLESRMPTFLELRDIEAKPPADDALVLCNCNLVPESVRTGKGDDVVVVEWHFAGSLTAELEVGYVLAGWMMRPYLNEVAVRAFVDGYRAATGGFPDLDLSSFAVVAAGTLNWNHSQICEAIDPETEASGGFAEREAVDVLADPLSVAKLERLLKAVGRALAA